MDQMQNEYSIIEISKNSLNYEELFLTNGFKLIFSQNFVKLITALFTNKFMVVYRADSMQLIKRFVDLQKQTVYAEKTTNIPAIAAEIFESYGTIRFVNVFPLVIRAILTGGTLVVDEFDASIHPMALLIIVNIFHNDDTNIH